MEIVIYSEFGNPQRDFLIKEISQSLQHKPVMVYDFESLFFIFRSKLGKEFLTLFLISSEKELESLISKKEYISRLRTILILPEYLTQLISKGFLLQPRYLSYMDNGFKDVSAVINKMLWNAEQIC